MEEKKIEAFVRMIAPWNKRTLLFPIIKVYLMVFFLWFSFYTDVSVQLEEAQAL